MRSNFKPIRQFRAAGGLATALRLKVRGRTPSQRALRPVGHPLDRHDEASAQTLQPDISRVDEVPSGVFVGLMVALPIAGVLWAGAGALAFALWS